MNNSARRAGRVQNILIVLLFFSALFLMRQSALYHEFERLLLPQRAAEQGYARNELLASAEIEVRPLQILLQWKEGRYGLQYDETAIAQIYDNLLSIYLKEAIGEVEEIHPMTEEAWREKILHGTSWVYFDFPANMPFLELSVWLGKERENPILRGYVHSFLLEETEEGIFLSYRNETDGVYYESNRLSIQEGSLSQIVLDSGPNDALFAFEQEGYSALMNPNTILISRSRAHPVYQVKNPLEGSSEEAWGDLLKKLSFHSKYSSYEVMGTRVQTEGEESLRLSEQGLVVYENLGSEMPKFSVEDGSLRSRVEYAKSILDLLLSDQLGDADTYLSAVEERADGTLAVRFSYLLDGVPVQLMREGYAAEFLFSGSEMTKFQVHVRHYSKTETERTTFPIQQAVAVLLELGQRERTLTLGYIDPGENGGISVSWTAV